MHSYHDPGKFRQVLNGLCWIAFRLACLFHAPQSMCGGGLRSFCYNSDVNTNVDDYTCVAISDPISLSSLGKRHTASYTTYPVDLLRA